MIHLRPLTSSACLFFKALVAFFADTKQTTRNEKGLPYLHILGIWHGALCSLIVFFLLSVPESTAQSYCKERPPSTNKKKRELYLTHWVSTRTRVHVQHYPIQSRFFLFAASARWQTLMPLEAKSILTWSPLLSHLGITQVPLPSRLWRLNLISAWAKNRIRLWFFSLFVAHS